MSQTMMHIIFALLVVANGLAAVKSPKRTLSEVLPHLYRCNRYQTNLPYCIKRSLRTMQPYLQTGILRWGIPSFAPYEPDNYEFTWNKKFYGRASFRNTRIHGITTYMIRQVEVSTGADQIKFEAHFPLIQVFTTYGVHATINNVSIEQSSMQAIANITNLKAEIELNGEFYDDNEEVYFRLHYVLVRLEVGRYKFDVNPQTEDTKYTKRFLKDSLKTAFCDKHGVPTPEAQALLYIKKLTKAYKSQRRT